MLDIQPEKVMEVVSRVSESTNYLFEPEEVTEQVRFTVRKCERLGKDEAYFYILLENELTDYLMRAVINFRSEENRMRRMAQQSVPV